MSSSPAGAGAAASSEMGRSGYALLYALLSDQDHSHVRDADSPSRKKEVKEVLHAVRKELFSVDLVIDADKIEHLPVICAICKDLCCDVVRLKECEHNFCRACVLTSLAVKPECPMCKAGATKAAVETTKSWARMIDSIRVRCLHAECKWTGDRGSLEDHLVKSCTLEPFTCGGCKERVLRVKADEHKILTCSHRRVKCDRCQAPVEFRHLAKHVKDECEKDPTPCTVGELRKAVREERERWLDLDMARADRERAALQARLARYGAVQGEGVSAASGIP